MPTTEWLNKYESIKDNTWSAPRLQGVNKFFKAHAPRRSILSAFFQSARPKPRTITKR